MEQEKTIIFELNDAARLTPNMEHRRALKDMALNIGVAVDSLASTPTTEKMIALNGLWVRAVCLLGQVQNAKPPAGNGGAEREGARLAA